MQISIITLNYNGSQETIELLKSLKDQTDKDFKIIVVDNASEEVDFVNLQNKLIHSFSLPTSQVVYPQVINKSQLPTCDVGYPQILRNDINLGFSGGNNVGIKRALQNGSSWIVLLNNDTWVEKGFMERLKVFLSVRKGIIGIPLIEDGLKSQNNRGENRTAYCGRVQWLKPTLIHSFSLPTCDVGYPQVYAIGGAVAIHKDVFEKIGLLDEKFFLYFEDADFSVRAREAGFDIFIAENLNVHHHVSSSTKKLGSPLLLRYHYRNALYFNLKNGPWYIKLAVWPWSWFIAIKQLIKIIINQNIEESKAILVGVIDFYKNKMGKTKTDK